MDQDEGALTTETRAGSAGSLTEVMGWVLTLGGTIAFLAKVFPRETLRCHDCGSCKMDAWDNRKGRMGAISTLFCPLRACLVTAFPLRPEPGCACRRTQDIHA